MVKSYLLILLALVSMNSVAQSDLELDTVNTFDMEKMSRSINSSYHEGGPVISADGNKLYFFRTNHPRNLNGDKETQDIWYSLKEKKGNWSEAENAGSVLNRYQSNQAFAIINGGNFLLDMQ